MTLLNRRSLKAPAETGYQPKLQLQCGRCSQSSLQKLQGKTLMAMSVNAPYPLQVGM